MLLMGLWLSAIEYCWIGLCSYRICVRSTTSVLCQRSLHLKMEMRRVLLRTWQHWCIHAVFQPYKWFLSLRKIITILSSFSFSNFPKLLILFVKIILLTHKATTRSTNVQDNSWVSRILFVHSSMGVTACTLLHSTSWDSSALNLRTL